MKNVLIEMNIISSNIPYYFKGNGKIDKRVISFNDDIYSYEFNLDSNILLKTKDNEKMLIDFLNKEISIEDEDINIDFNIEVLSIENVDNLYRCIYKVEKDSIDFTIKYEVRNE